MNQSSIECLTLAHYRRFQTRPWVRKLVRDFEQKSSFLWFTGKPPLTTASSGWSALNAEKKIVCCFWVAVQKPSFYLEYQLQQFLVNDIGPIQANYHYAKRISKPRNFPRTCFLRSCLKKIFQKWSLNILFCSYFLFSWLGDMIVGAYLRTS